MGERLIDQVAIVTGGSRGIGYAIAESFTREGAMVVIASLDNARGHAAVLAIREHGGQVAFVQTDVTQSSDVDRLIESTLEQYGDINILVNNAGAHDGAPFWLESSELWQCMYQVNVLGTALPSQAVVRHMKDRTGGAIVNVASKAGVVGEPGHAAYSAAKGAVISMTRAMAIELAPYAIRVNAVCPGPVETDMLKEAVPSEEGRRQITASVPLGRVGQPEDIAEAAVYLASSESAWCTGQALGLDGGLSILK